MADLGSGVPMGEATAQAAAATFGATDAPAEVLSRKERIDRYGIDSGSGLCWAGGTWGPGGEYIKNLTIKNLSERVRKIKYKVPATKFFYLDFPEVITLAPGNHKQIEVRFRPIRYEEYEDFIEFWTDVGRFKVPISARLAVLRIRVPERLDFGFCPVNEVASQELLVENTGQIPATYEWFVDSPFQMEPASGTVEPGDTATVVCSFAPTDASVHESNVMVMANGEQRHSMVIEAIGKYPHIVADTPHVDFGDMLVGLEGAPVQRIVNLINPSQVHATFRVENVESDRSPQFAIHPNHGVVEAGASLPLRVTYMPRSNGMYTDENFDLVTPGGNTPRLRCTGFAAGPAITIAKKEAAGSKRPGKPNALNFGDVKVGSVVTRVLFLKNDSNVEAFFQFQCEPGAAFHFDRVQGVIPPLLSTFVTLTFRPDACLNFYRRVYCLIRDQSPVFVDLVGTGHDEKVHPMPLTQRHVDAFLNRPDQWQKMAPADVDEYVARHGKFDPTEEQKREWAEAASEVSRSGDATKGELDVLRDFFLPLTNHEREVWIHEEILDFGAGSRTKRGDRKAVHITNNTKAKITVQWRVPTSIDPDSEADWRISPESQDCAPGKTVEFRIAFQPTQENFYYCQELEAICFYKSNRTFRLVNHESFTPPWTVPIRVMGHTFAGADQFLPRCSLSLKGSPAALDFPPCHVGDCVYQTFQLTNTSDTPAVFQLPEDPSGVFTCRPTAGSVEKNAFQLIAVRFKPRLARTYKFNLGITLNNASDSNIPIIATGAGCVPRAKLSHNNLLYFKPTCLGASSRREMTLTSLSRIPTRFQWRIPERVAEEIRVRPSRGVLRGNEHLTLRWKFAPRAEKQYNVKIPMDLYAVSGPMDKPVQTVLLTIVGDGSPGALKFDPPNIDFGTVMVNDAAAKQLVIENMSGATLRYKVDVLPEAAIASADADGDGIVEASEIVAFREGHPKAKQILAIDDPEGTIEARSRFVTNVHFRPKSSGRFTYRLFYSIHEPGSSGASSSRGPAVSESRRALEMCMPALKDRARGELNSDPMWCEIEALAGYPSVAFDDVRLLSSPSIAPFPGADPSARATPGQESLPSGFGLTTTSGVATGPMGAGISTTMSTLRVASDGATWRLWRQFSLYHLNQSLAMPLSEAEIRYNKATQLKRDPETLDTCVLEFTPGMIGSAKMEVVFSLLNTSNLTSEVQFVFPTDQEVELEPWAEVGEPSRTDLVHQDLVDKAIFDIQPRQAKLAPGTRTCIKMHFAYTSLAQSGKHELPVIMALAGGKQVRLILRGRTLEPTQPHLTLSNPRQEGILDPVPIGVMAPPVQSVHLYNPSSVDIRFVIDETPLRKLVEDNYNFEILRCVNSTGLIPAGSQTTVQLVFRPLEARQYTVDLDVGYGSAEAVDGSASGAGGLSGLIKLRVVAEGFAPDKPSVHAEPDAPVGYSGIPMAEEGGVEDGVESVEGPDKVQAERELRRVVALLTDSEAVEPVKPSPATAGQRDGLPGLRGVTAWEEAKWGGVGAGSHAVQLARNSFFIGATPPLSRVVPIPPEYKENDELVTLSIDWLRFGDVPQGALSYRMLVLRNTRDHGSVQFHWDTFHPLIARRLVKVHPKEGRIPFGGHAACKVTFTASCSPETFSADLPCVFTVPDDEMRAEAEGAARKAAELRRKEMRDAARNPSKVRETPHRSVIFRTTASRQANLEASGRGLPTDFGTSRVPSRGAGMSVADGTGMESVMGGGSIVASRSGMGLGTATSGIPREATARTLRSRASRATRSEIGDVVVPLAPTATLQLHITARVCAKQEFLLVHPSAHLKSFFVPSAAPATVPPVVLDHISSGVAESESKTKAAAASEEQMLVEDVMASLLQDLVNDASVGDTYATLPKDPVPVFGQLNKDVPATLVEDALDGSSALKQERLAALRGPECREVVARLLENTLLNVLKEAAHGEFNLKRPPLQVVKLEGGAAE